MLAGPAAGDRLSGPFAVAQAAEAERARRAGDAAGRAVALVGVGVDALLAADGEVRGHVAAAGPARPVDAARPESNAIDHAARAFVTAEAAVEG